MEEYKLLFCRLEIFKLVSYQNILYCNELKRNFTFNSTWLLMLDRAGLELVISQLKCSIRMFHFTSSPFHLALSIAHCSSHATI